MIYSKVNLIYLEYINNNNVHYYHKILFIPVMIVMNVSNI